MGWFAQTNQKICRDTNQRLSYMSEMSPTPEGAILPEGGQAQSDRIPPFNVTAPTVASAEHQGTRSFRLRQVLLYGVPLLLTLCAGFGLGFFVAKHTGPAADPELLTQSGTLAPAGYRGPYKVFYPVPFASPPHLTFPTSPIGYTLKDQRADGFEIDIQIGGVQEMKWEAKGQRARNGK